MKSLWDLVTVIATTISCAVLITPAVGAEAKRPNVVFIMTDNHGAWTLGCYGNRDIRTPHIDQLAKEGVLFRRAFASNPVCSPTRATCLTGLMPSQHGVHSFLSGGNLQTGPNARCTLDQLTSLPEVLRDQGYACGLVGKWHLGGNLQPQEGLDDYWITMPHGGTSTFYDAKIIENGQQRDEPKYLTEFWTDHAVKFIQQQSKTDDPFFLFLAYNGPYSLGRLLLRDGQNRHAEFYADKPLPSFPREPPHTWQLNNLDYINNPTSIRRVATEVSGVDDGVGRVMQTLKKNGIDDNTIVIFIADQGWVGGHGGFFGMGDHTQPLTARDGMMQIPLIWRQPGAIAANRVTDQMFANYDVMPTLLGCLGLTEKMPNTPKSPGKDFSYLLSPKDKTEPIERPVFYEFENLRCIRTERWKLVKRFPNGPDELYDLANDADEFQNLIDKPKFGDQRQALHKQLSEFFGEYVSAEYDMWNGGTSQVRIHRGIDEELAQLEPIAPPKLPDGFQPHDIRVPDGYSVQLAAGPPLVTHPTLGCFDDRGRLYVCNNAGVNMTNEELEKALPNSIVQLRDQDGDGQFDQSIVFADKMTFPMGGVWHEGSLYVASPPNIWRLTDTNDDGVADERTPIVTEFGYTGNAASIHGCFLGPDGRIYWVDGYHGHEFTDDRGNVVSKREGSYLFSCQPDGSDVQIHCGGGMDNPVEVDFTSGGDMLGTVNILYTRPRVDCFVHWLHGGAYPHREKVLGELKVTGDFLGPVHRFGHVAISGTTRYRSGAMDHRFRDDWFATFFNRGKVVRLQLVPEGATYKATQHEFLHATSRDFHPTDVIEDADGSLLVVDTGGWFYRGCPTSQFAKPDVLGGIYRVKRNNMTSLVDPRGNSINWESVTGAQLVRLMNDTRFEVRRQAIQHAARSGKKCLATLLTYVKRGDIQVRQNCVWALSRLVSDPQLCNQAIDGLHAAIADNRPEILQAACHALTLVHENAEQTKKQQSMGLLVGLLNHSTAAVQRSAATALGKLQFHDTADQLLAVLDNDIDRSLQHAIIYALIELENVHSLRSAMESRVPAKVYGALIALDQLNQPLDAGDVLPMLESDNQALSDCVRKLCSKRPEWKNQIAVYLTNWLSTASSVIQRESLIADLLPKHASDPKVAVAVSTYLQPVGNEDANRIVRQSIGSCSKLPLHPDWEASVAAMLDSADQKQLEQAIAIAAAIDTKAFDPKLESISLNDSVATNTRLKAIEVIAKRNLQLTNQTFSSLIGPLVDTTSPNAANQAAEILSNKNLSNAQLLTLASLLSDLSATQLRSIIRSFARTRDVKVIDSFFEELKNAKSFLTLPENELSDVIKRYPTSKLRTGNMLLDRLKRNEQEKLQRLTELRDRINEEGNAVRGRAVFFGTKAKCISCHQMGEKGTQVGPNLTTIGANRSRSDLLESIVMPSASIVRDYESYKVLTSEGRVIAGMIASETVEHISIQPATGSPIKVKRDEIESMVPNPISIMPNGLDEALTETELADVIEYLSQQK